MEQPLYQVTMVYTPEMLKKSVLRFWKRALGWRYFIAMLLVAFALIVSFIRGDTSWMTGAMAVILTLGIVFGITLYLNHYHHVLGTLKALQNPQATFTIYEDKFMLSSDLGEGSWPWSTIKEIWQYPDAWLVFLARSSYATFPLDSISKEAQAIILKKVEEAGGIIS